MAKTKPYIPPHYVNEDAYVADLERELAGYRNRVAEWKAMGAKDEDNVIVEAHAGEAAVLGVLKSIGHGQGDDAPKPRGRPPKVAAE